MLTFLSMFCPSFSAQGFYANPVDPAVRSLMNVPFTIPSSPDLEKVCGAVTLCGVCDVLCVNCDTLLKFDLLWMG